MPRGLVRYQQCGVFHFVTFSCYRREPLLASGDAYRIFEEVLEWTRLRSKLVIAGYVLMPEHVHLLVGEPLTGTLSSIIQVLKQRTSRSFPALHLFVGDRQNGVHHLGERRVFGRMPHSKIIF